MSLPELRTRSAFSFLEGASLPEAMIAQAAELAREMPELLASVRRAQRELALSGAYLLLSIALFAGAIVFCIWTVGRPLRALAQPLNDLAADWAEPAIG